MRWTRTPHGLHADTRERHGGQWFLTASAKDDEPVINRPFEAIPFSFGHLRP